MKALIPGALAFVFFLFYDILNIRAARSSKWFFAVGALLLIVSTVLIVERGAVNAFMSGTVPFLIGLAGAGFSLAALLYSLFLALPAKKTYIEGGRRKVIARGIYALCRHPGVWPMSAFYLFLYIILRTWTALAAWLLFTALNVIYSAAQDRWIFPKVLEGYNEYKRKTPFLIPRFK